MVEVVSVFVSCLFIPVEALVVPYYCGHWQNCCRCREYEVRDLVRSIKCSRINKLFRKLKALEQSLKRENVTIILISGIEEDIVEKLTAGKLFLKDAWERK
jgi:hypothetical protein